MVCFLSRLETRRNQYIRPPMRIDFRGKIMQTVGEDLYLVDTSMSQFCSSFLLRIKSPAWEMTSDSVVGGWGYVFQENTRCDKVDMGRYLYVLDVQEILEVDGKAMGCGIPSKVTENIVIY